MAFETLTLRPVDGHLDRAAIHGWLDAAPYVFLDPVERRMWHMEASPRTAILARLAREADPSRFPPGVLVWTDDAAIHVEAQADGATLRRLRGFLSWLSARGEWVVKTDWGEPHLLLDLDDLFRGVDLGAADVVDDLTVPPVVLGTLTRVGHVDTQLHVHSGGQLRLEDGDRTTEGTLAPAAAAAWNAAVTALDPDDPALPDDPDEAFAWTVTWETPEGEDFAMLDVRTPPPSFAALVPLAMRWIDALRGGTPVAELNAG